MLKTTSSPIASKSIYTGESSIIKEISYGNNEVDKVMIKASIVSKANTRTF